MTLPAPPSEQTWLRGRPRLGREEPTTSSSQPTTLLCESDLRAGYYFALGVVLRQGNREGAESEFRQELKYHPANGLGQMQIDRMEKAPSTVRSSTKSTQNQKIN
jgi:hypothetical protein